MDPAFEHVAAADLPIVEDMGAHRPVIMGELWGAAAPTTTYAQTIYADIALEARRECRSIPSPTSVRFYLAMARPASTGSSWKPMTLYVLRPGITATCARKQGGRVMLCGGEAFKTPRHVWWNFVSSSRDRINQAKEDWKAGNFPKVPATTRNGSRSPKCPRR
jgi:redox-sensitive bicupin YhaK (pirin superfamily)